MADKKAFVFDTNFIIQNKELDIVLDALKEDFTVYATQVSIDERIAQVCRSLREDFDEAEHCKTKFSKFATVEFKKSFDEMSEFCQKGMQERYEEYFGEYIIPFKKDGKTLSTIIDRANKRLPPFSSAKDASDKGFKDCLLWLSILDFFKENGEVKVVLLTDDKSAFRNHTKALEGEFHNITGKTIEIHPNSYYKELIKQNNDSKEISDDIQELATKDWSSIISIREEIEESLEALRCVDYENEFGDPRWSRTFITDVPFDKEYIKVFFNSLRSDIDSHLFESSIPAEKILDFDGRVSNGDMEIPMENLEKALIVYQRVLSNYSQYSEQFYEAAAKILNRNYIMPKVFADNNDDDLPF